MTDQENPGTVHVRLIEDECLALLENTSETRLNTDAKIMLATIMLADDEGVAHLEGGQLARWCGEPGYARAGRGFLSRRITYLTKVGVLAPGSRPTELRSMVGRAAYAATEEVAA